MRVLITGACGFVGRKLGSFLQSQGHEVYGTYLGEDPDLDFPCRKLDVASSEECSRIILDLLPECIFHLAGVAFVPEAEDNFVKALLVNVGGTGNVFRVAHLLDRPLTLVLVSSAEVYGKIHPADLPLTESSAIQPANNYSLTKAMAEMAAERYLRGNTKLRGIIMRPFNHIGPGQDDRFVASSFARQLARIATKQAEPVIRVGNLDAKRDFSDVRDIIRAYALAAERGQGVYNVGSGRSSSVKELLDTLLDIAGIDVRIELDPSRMRASEVPEVYGSNAKAERELSWTPEFSLRQSLETVYAYWLERERARTA